MSDGRLAKANNELCEKIENLALTTDPTEDEADSLLHLAMQMKENCIKLTALREQLSMLEHLEK